MGNWVYQQRFLFTKGKLPKERHALLESIGFSLKSKRPNRWIKMYERLVAYNKKHGTTCVRREWEGDPQLAIWVANQRRGCKKQDRINLLNKIGFVWKVQSHWMVMYGRLVAFKKKYGTTQVPCGWKTDPQLAIWVSTQRRDCKKQDRINRLNEIDFVWNHWREMYGRLVAYKEKHGSTEVPKGWKTDPKLASWVHNQRKCCKKQDRIDRLDEINFVWRVQGR